VALPDGAVLLAGATLRAEAGDTMLLPGPLGQWQIDAVSHPGRHLALCQRQIRLPATPGQRHVHPAAAVFSERPLRDALAYPQPASHLHRRPAAVQALQDALLPQLVDQLDTPGRLGSKALGR
jgi:hypothetical protein